MSEPAQRRRCRASRDDNNAPRRTRTQDEIDRPIDVSDRESPLAWLARRKDKDGTPLISAVEFAAGEKLRADFWFAQMTPGVTANWSRLLSGGGGRRGSPDHGAELQDHAMAARDRVSRALAAAGPDLAGILIDVCCHLKGLEVCERRSGLPKRAGKVVLQIGLRHLARHYGLMPTSEPGNSQQRANRIRHWGTADFRPHIDAPDDSERSSDR